MTPILVEKWGAFLWLQSHHFTFTHALMVKHTTKEFHLGGKLKFSNKYSQPSFWHNKTKYSLLSCFTGSCYNGKRSANHATLIDQELIKKTYTCEKRIWGNTYLRLNLYGDRIPDESLAAHPRQFSLLLSTPSIFLCQKKQDHDYHHQIFEKATKE